MIVKPQLNNDLPFAVVLLAFLLQNLTIAPCAYLVHIHEPIRPMQLRLLSKHTVHGRTRHVLFAQELLD